MSDDSIDVLRIRRLIEAAYLAGMEHAAKVIESAPIPPRSDSTLREAWAAAIRAETKDGSGG